MEEKYKLYDSINTTAMRWLAHLAKEHVVAIVYDNSSNEEFQWVLILSQYLSKLYDCEFYFISSLKDFIYFKFIKKFYFLKRASKRNTYFEIKPHTFVKEIQDYFNINYNIIDQIYNNYYRGKKR